MLNLDYRPEVDENAIFQKFNLVNLASNGSKGLELYSRDRKGKYTYDLIREGIRFCDEVGYIINFIRELKTNSADLDISHSEKGRRNFKNLYTFRSFAPLFLQEGFTLEKVSNELNLVRDALSKYLDDTEPVTTFDCLHRKLHLLRLPFLGSANKEWELSKPYDALKKIVV